MFIFVNTCLNIFPLCGNNSEFNDKYRKIQNEKIRITDHFNMNKLIK